MNIMKREINNWMQDAKDLARAERELKIEHWVYVTIEERSKDRERTVLFKYDIPRQMLDRWRWVIEWRKAKLTCKFPRKNIITYFCYYDRRTGLQTGFNFLLSRVAAAKAQVTKVERVIFNYIDYKKHNDLFFNICADEQLIKAKYKLKQKKENYNKLNEKLQEEVNKHRNNSNKFKLYIGYKKIGEYSSIFDAKQQANKSNLTGCFNLIGNKYRDSWYVSKKG